MLRLKLLGGFDARHNDTPLLRLHQERLQSFLACLLLSPNGTIARRELAYRFWPDTSDRQARTNLHTLLARLRDALPEPDRYLALDTLTAGIRTDAPIESDVSSGRRAWQRATIPTRPGCVSTLCVHCHLRLLIRSEPPTPPQQPGAL